MLSLWILWWKIRNKDPSIYDKDKKFFEEDDFEDDEELGKGKSKK